MRALRHAIQLRVPIILLVALAVGAPTLAAGPPSSEGRFYAWGDPFVDTVDEVAHHDLSTGTTTPLTLGGMTGGDVIHAVGVSSGGTMIAVGGLDDVGLNGTLNRYSALGGVAINLHSGDSDDNYRDITFSPDSAWVAFIADIELNGADALYVVPSGGGTVTRLSQAPIGSSQDVSTYAWSIDSQRIVYAGDPVTVNVTSIWTVDVTSPSPVEIIPGNPLDPDVGATIAFDADNRVYFVSDYELEGVFRLYRADVDGSNLEQVPGTGLTNGGGDASIGTIGMSLDGTRIAFSSDSPDDELYQVYTMPVSGSTPTLVSNVMTVPDATTRGPGFEPIAWSPDGTRLAVAADWNPGDGTPDNDYGAFVLPAQAPAGGIRVLAVSAINIDVAQVAFASATDLVVRGDLVANNETEIYGISDFSTADQDPNTVVIVDVVANGDVDGFVVVPPAAISPPEPTPNEPTLLSVTDVGNDQGKQVSLSWRASGLDVPGSETPITEYAIFRKIDPDLRIGAGNEAMRSAGSHDGHATRMPPGWHYLLSVPAFTDTTYAVVAPTLRDSTITDGVYYSVFLVRAATSVPSVFFDSPPDSGYSVDNLAPAVPANLAFDAPRVLVWDASAETDFAYHTVYGSPTGLLGDAVFIGYTVDPTFDVNAEPNNYYLVTTTDFSGNEGLPASLLDPDTVDIPSPGSSSAILRVVARPNPFRAEVAITFDVPRTSSVTAQLFDSQGRELRRLFDGSSSPGPRTIAWDGTDRAGRRMAPGVYFVRISAGEITVVRRLVRLK